jgi:hypothetical protein
MVKWAILAISKQALAYARFQLSAAILRKRQNVSAPCLDQYRANKAINANGGLKWIHKRGGYYGECNKQLKGQA